MAAVSLEFVKNVKPGDPNTRPVTILGKKDDLEGLHFSRVSPYLGGRVTEEVYIEIYFTSL